MFLVRKQAHERLGSLEPRYRGHDRVLCLAVWGERGFRA